MELYPEPGQLQRVVILIPPLYSCHAYTVAMVTHTAVGLWDYMWSNYVFCRNVFNFDIICMCMLHNIHKSPFICLIHTNISHSTVSYLHVLDNYTLFFPTLLDKH